MTKEEKREYNKNYKEANKEKIAVQQKVYKEANKEKIDAYHKDYSKKWIDSKKDGLYTVYLLPEENYVGQTNNLYQRLVKHRCRDERNTSGMQVIGKYNTREQAMNVEADYHSKGYLGANRNT